MLDVTSGGYMKKAFLLCCLLCLLAGLSGNPVIARAVERVWFAANGDFYVRFASENGGGDYYLDYLPGFTFSTSSGMWAWPVGFVAPTALPWQCNLSQTIPGFTIDPMADMFTMNISENFYERVQWSSASDLYTDIHPLETGQSAVQVRIREWDYAGVSTWAKDNGISYPSNPFYPVHSCNISIQVKDQEGNGVAGVPIDYTYTFNHPWHNNIDLTDAEGIWAENIYAARIWLRVLDPLNQNAVLDTLLYPEPDSTYSFEAVVTSVANNDPVQTPGIGSLTLYPTVLTPSSGKKLHLKYEADNSLIQAGELTLYDLRGRALASMIMPVSGQTEWTLPSLSSGIYFVGLSDSGKQLARQRLTVIK